MQTATERAEEEEVVSTTTHEASRVSGKQQKAQSVSKQASKTEPAYSNAVVSVSRAISRLRDQSVSHIGH